MQIQTTAISNKIVASLLSEQLQVVPSQKKDRQLTHRQRTRMSCVLARAFMRVDKDFDLSTSLKLAWYIVKNFEDSLQLIHFVTVKGQVKQRVVYVEPWSYFYEVKGTGRPLKEGLNLFVDVAKHFLCKHATVSIYSNNIIEKI